MNNGIKKICANSNLDLWFLLKEDLVIIPTGMSKLIWSFLFFVVGLRDSLLALRSLLLGLSLCSGISQSAF